MEFKTGVQGFVFSHEDKNSRNSIKGGFFCWLQIYVFRLEDLSIQILSKRRIFEEVKDFWRFESFRKILILKIQLQNGL